MTKKLKSNTINIFEAFAGIGSQRKALDNQNIKYKVVGLAEWYVPAIIAYHAIHNDLNLNTIINHNISKKEMIDFLESKNLSMDSKTQLKKGYWSKKNLDQLRIVYTAVKMSKDSGNIFDIKNLYKSNIHNIDLLTYSFPCQDLSQQGKQKGMSKGLKTRSGLLWEIEKYLVSIPKKYLPKYLLMENVYSLMHKTYSKDLNLWISKLSDLGYKNDIKVLNSGDFGSPQIRRRVFMISTLGKKIKLPIGKENPKPIKVILNKIPKEKDFMPALDEYDLTDFRLTKSNIKKAQLKKYSTFNSETYVYDFDYSGPTLTASGANSRIKIKYKNKIRKLNSKETFKYMGFNDNDYSKIKNLNYLSEAKMIYLCGNSIPIEILEAIFKEMKNE